MAPPRVTVRYVLYLDSTRFRWIAVSLPFVPGFDDDEEPPAAMHRAG